ncbi:hypothetical protein TSUD_141240 [Trifolium subterraneum]|uniref:Pentatricopeptide repeat-containing protein n=1 Tax=Trifolium subterraneum TaxID=3900 RepID=A0A2Z6NRY6_TRISU|nr:hypothetical protein TSUD_141240 [Trifolium subterraneum]
MNKAARDILQRLQKIDGDNYHQIQFLLINENDLFMLQGLLGRRILVLIFLYEGVFSSFEEVDQLLVNGPIAQFRQERGKTKFKLKQIQTLIFSTGLQQDRDTLNKLMAVSIQDFHYALRIFNHTQHPSLFIYNLIIKAFVKKASFTRAISVFNQLREDGLWPDNYTYPYVLKAIGCMGYVGQGEKLDQARDLFDKSPTRDVVLWTAMINGYVQFNCFDEAIALFGEMQVRGVKPDKFIVVALLTCCAQLGTLEHGRWEDASNARSKMKDLHIKKVRGCSAIEVDDIGNWGGVGDFPPFQCKFGENSFSTLNSRNDVLLCLVSCERGIQDITLVLVVQLTRPSTVGIVRHWERKTWIDFGDGLDPFFYT